MFSLPPFRRIPSLVLALTALSVLPACGGKNDGNAKSSAATKTVSDTFAIKIGDRVANMQVAVLPGELQRGLMFRKTLGPDDGMLFAFARPQQLSFYMRNTSLPLDIGYISSTGVLKEVYAMYPYDETSVISRGSDLQYALEMNQGWFADRGVRPGAKIDLKALAFALAARGLQLQVGEQP